MIHICFSFLKYRNWKIRERFEVHFVTEDGLLLKRSRSIVSELNPSVLGAW